MVTAMSLPKTIQFPAISDEKPLTIPGPHIGSSGWIDAAYGECWTRRVSDELVTVAREGCVFRGVLMLIVTINWASGRVSVGEEQPSGQMKCGTYLFCPVQPYARVDGSICEYEWRVAA